MTEIENFEQLTNLTNHCTTSVNWHYRECPLIDWCRNNPDIHIKAETVRRLKEMEKTTTTL